MLDRVRGWLDGVALQDPIERRQAPFFQAMLIGLIILMILGIPITLATPGPPRARLLAIAAELIALTCVLAAFAILRRGRFRAAVLLAAIGILSAISIDLLVTGIGASGSLPLAIAIPMALAGLLAGRRQLAIVSAAAALVVVGLAALETLAPDAVGLTPEPYSQTSVVAALVLFIAVLYLCFDRFGAAHRETLAALRESNRQLHEALALLDDLLLAAPIGIAYQDTELRYQRVNDALAAISGRVPQAHLGRTPQEVHPELAATLEPLQRQVLAAGAPVADLELRADLPAAPGQPRDWLVSCFPVRLRAGTLIGVGTLVKEITEHKRLEAQLYQSHRMESIGRLAGGIAHDFNNMLTAILGYADLLQGDLPPESPLRADVEEIVRSAERAATLTRQLLIFARKQTIEPRVLSLNAIIADMQKLLHRLLGEHVQLVTRLDPGLGSVRADPGQIEQVIVNLAVNARDAMPGGGMLTLLTENIAIDAPADQGDGAAPGSYVLLTVSDTGLGMDDETQRRIFEPFFTTKAPGLGTGLGLATCYGIVRNHGGQIACASAPGRGTIFRVYLPRVDAPAEAPWLAGSQDDLPRGDETILLVEDEEAVRALAARMLAERGYRVLAAANGEDALRLASDYAPGTLDLLVTDVVMPGLDGRALSQRIADLHPSIRVLYISGYTGGLLAPDGQQLRDAALLQKPFSAEALAYAVRGMLDA